MNRGHAWLVTCLAAVALVVPASALTFTSVQSGDWGAPATWGHSGPAQPGVNVPANNDNVNIGHSLTMAPTDSYTAGDFKANFTAGGNLTVNGGYFYVGRTSFNNVPHTLTVDNGGHLRLGRAQNMAADFKLNALGGVLQWDHPFALSVATGVVDGGRLRLPATNITAGGATWTIQSGTFDAGFGVDTFASSSSFHWNGGTIANLNQPHDYFQNIVGNLGDNAARRIDINDQYHRQTAQVWNMVSPRNWQGRLVGTAGTVQFDIYSAFVNDCDSIINAANNSSLGSGVIFDIGYAGGEISDPTAFLGQDYRLLTLLSGTDYSALLASVPDAVWFDGVREWLVSFSNNVATDGSIRIASIAPMQTAIPEPLTALAVLAGLGGLGRYLRRRQ